MERDAVCCPFPDMHGDGGAEADILNSRGRRDVLDFTTGWCKAEGICRLCDRGCFKFQVSLSCVMERDPACAEKKKKSSDTNK